MKRRYAALGLLLLLGGCVSLPRTAPPEAAAPIGRYEAEPGREAATVAAMRAAPAPAMPELLAGKVPLGDHNRLAAQGYVRIGSAHLPGSEAQVRETATRQGQQAGADRVLLYPPSADGSVPDADAHGAWLATYYVRFQLPFGATFRDLRAAERAALDAPGGVVLGSVIGGTPASRANLIAGDIVLKVDGKPIADRAAFQSLLKHGAGRAVTLTIVRNGETLQRVVRLGAPAPTNR